MADADDKSAAEEDQQKTEEAATASAEGAPVEGAAEADNNESADEGAGADASGESAGEEPVVGGVSDDASSADEEAVTDDIWAEALKEAGDTEESAAPEVVPESSGEESALSDAAQPADFTELTGSGTGTLANMDMILDIPVTISVELGRAEMMIKDILQLGQGSVVELEKMAGEAMEILVNGRLVARGEVVMVNEKFGVRLTDIISPSERVKRLA
ncbi:MAG: flagellar motor switch protein FliN [Thermodesulfobacteriota bacterium]